MGFGLWTCCGCGLGEASGGPGARVQSAEAEHLALVPATPTGNWQLVSSSRPFAIPFQSLSYPICCCLIAGAVGDTSDAADGTRHCQCCGRFRRCRGRHCRCCGECWVLPVLRAVLPVLPMSWARGAADAKVDAADVVGVAVDDVSDAAERCRGQCYRCCGGRCCRCRGRCCRCCGRCCRCCRRCCR